MWLKLTAPCSPESDVTLCARAAAARNIRSATAEQPNRQDIPPTHQLHCRSAARVAPEPRSPRRAAAELPFLAELELLAEAIFGAFRFPSRVQVRRARTADGVQAVVATAHRFGECARAAQTHEYASSSH